MSNRNPHHKDLSNSGWDCQLSRRNTLRSPRTFVRSATDRSTNCWINTANPENRHDLLQDAPQKNDKIEKKSRTEKLSADSPENMKSRRKKKGKHRSAMAMLSRNFETD